MPADPVTAVGDALAGLFGVLKPVVDEHYAQAIDNAARQRMSDFNDILAAPDSDDRAFRLARFVGQLRDAASVASGGVEGSPLIRISMADLCFFVQCAVLKIADDARLARLTFKL